MKAKTLAALKKSIKHWEQNVVAKTPEEASIGPDDCALCGLFIDNLDAAYNSCIGCPVREKTGQELCEGTPYELAANKYQDWRRASTPRSSFTRAAKAELKFLKSLLPKEKP